MKSVKIYTDGACSGNPGKGGWAAILIYNDREMRVSGGEEETTNNRMELRAIIEGLSKLKEACKVSVFSDSAYCVNAMDKGWLFGWMKNGWRTADNKEVKNQDLWQQFIKLTKQHLVTLIKVKGHADNEYNNLCDSMARAEILNYN